MKDVSPKNNFFSRCLVLAVEKSRIMGRNHENRIVSEVDPAYENKDWRQKKFRVAVYARVSTDSSDQENSLENQKRYYEALIHTNPNWVYVDMYVDDGISGTSTRNRKGYNRLVEDCLAGKIDLIIVKDVSRLARNMADCQNTVELLLTLDPPVGIYFENNNLNTLDTGNRLCLIFFAMFAELESAWKSESVKFGNNVCFEKGDYFWPTNLLGYKKVAKTDVNGEIEGGKYEIEIEPEGEKTVVLIYKLFLAGYSKKEIAEVMTSLSRPTAAGNLEWSPSSISGILKNEKYCGDMIMQKSFVENFKTHKAVRNKGQRKLYYEPDHHQRIVSRDEHARVLLLLKSDQASPYYDHRFVIRVIRQGLLSGFIPMNPAFGGYNASHYLCALEKAQISMAKIEEEVTYIAGAKRIRGELFSNRSAAAMTFSEHGLHFNAGCISLMKKTSYVEVLLHLTERLLAVRKTTQRNQNAIPWKALPIRARELSQIVHQLMGWQKGLKYKTAASCFSKNYEQVLFFDLTNCEFQFREDSKPANAIPRSDWISEFGESVLEHKMLYRRAVAEKLEKWKLSVEPSPVDGFELDITPLSRDEAENEIAKFRGENEK